MRDIIDMTRTGNEAPEITVPASCLIPVVSDYNSGMRDH